MACWSDRIVLSGMRFEGHHGVTEPERATRQPIEVDVEMAHDLRAAGATDDLAATIDYGTVFAMCRSIVEEQTFWLLEAIAEAIAARVLDRTRATAVRVRVRKVRVPVDGRLDFAAVEIERARSDRAG